jgi:glutathione peroxidase-family protein
LVSFTNLINQVYSDGDVQVKAIVVVNIKQDDPIARKTIPELMSLATKYGRNAQNALVIVCCPTDQGYYEPDTSMLIRLKLASEYGYGINPATVLTDKVNVLGTGAVPFWRWLQSNCRTPAGLGRLDGNFEKFLVSGRTGQPLRRYPRKYSALNMADDIEAVIAGKPLPPPRANWLESWRQAAVEAERDTYRFEKGLNYFDQEMQ